MTTAVADHAVIRVPPRTGEPRPNGAATDITVVRPAVPRRSVRRPRRAAHAISGCGAARRRDTLRLTVRGQIVLAVLAAVVTLVVAWWWGDLGALGDRPSPATTTVVVEPGQSLWQVAAVVSPSADTASLVARIMEANGLVSAADVRHGDRLIVPLR